MKLTGSIALVTGAAHRVGKAIAVELAREGGHIALHYGTSGDAARNTAAEIAKLGVEAFPIQADLSKPASIEALLASVSDHFGRLDVLVNSAASFEKRAFDDITAEDWDRVLAINLRAPFLVTQMATRLMNQAKRDAAGLVVNIADLSGVQAWVGYAHHGVSKAGLIHLTKIAARELAPGIRVNAIVPGAILPPPGVDADSPEWRNAARHVPLQHAGSPQDVGRSVVFLAQNDFITGAILPVDGGADLLGPLGH
jgi:NAD(P)-dependent dehydrogenase (short-subunit alcohol dehydrogenase family)